MSCNQLSKIHLYHDQALTASERAQVEAHLLVCAECRELLEELQNLSQLMATVPLPEMPSRALNRMYGSWWASAQVRDRGVRRLAGWLTAAAAAVLVLVPMSSSTRPSDNEVASSAWQETIAFIPPAGPRDDANAELVQVAQWLANDLSMDQGQTNPQ